MANTPEQWKKGPWLFRVFFEDEIISSYVGFLMDHESPNIQNLPVIYGEDPCLEPLKADVQ